MSRILGIDYGGKRVGLALSDPLLIIARPLCTLNREASGAWWYELEAVIAEQEVSSIVVGYPLNMKGEPSPQTQAVDRFITELEQRVAVPVCSYDERLSSVAAKRALLSQGIKTGRDKGAVDRTAAAIFLQAYLDARI